MSYLFLTNWLDFIYAKWQTSLNRKVAYICYEIKQTLLYKLIRVYMKFIQKQVLTATIKKTQSKQVEC